MKIQKGGMYGAAVVSVIVALSIFLTVALNVETETRQVTKYEYVTDTTGLFDFDDSPQYYDFDLNKNYTGYYLESTDPYWGGASFTSTAGQVITDDTDPEDYIPGGSVNNYYVNFEPIGSSTGTEDLTTAGISNMDPPGAPTDTRLIYAYLFYDSTNSYRFNMTYTGVVSLADIISAYSLDEYDKITFTTRSHNIADWIVFGSNTDYTNNAFRYVTADAQQYHTEYQGHPTTVAGFSAVYDASTKLVDIYSSFEPSSETWLRTLDANATSVLFSYTNSPSPNPYGHYLTYSAINLVPTIYMDISKGVTVSSTGSA